MAAIPSSGSLVATHDYYRRRLGSTSSNSSCGSAEYSGEVIPHHPVNGKPGTPVDEGVKALGPHGAFPQAGLPKSDPGHWWASFFFGKSTHPIMTTLSESPEKSGTFQVANGTIACGLAQEVMRQRHASEPSKSETGPPRHDQADTPPR
uniref:Pancreatic progenitor cell differentiation and proliferation factor n=1 Tax=Sphenodon punctatus TaxID=8508 RepID=A0A8D0L1M0_SPHPU